MVGSPLRCQAIRAEDENMTSGPKRPWFRYHLLTAVLMMIAASGMVWTNMRGYESDFEIFIPSTVTAADPIQVLCYGWPVRCCVAQVGVDTIWNARSVFVNVLVAVGILAAVALVSKSLFRRREGRKP